MNDDNADDDANADTDDDDNGDDDDDNDNDDADTDDDEDDNGDDDDDEDAQVSKLHITDELLFHLIKNLAANLNHLVRSKLQKQISNKYQTNIKQISVFNESKFSTNIDQIWFHMSLSYIK